MVIWQPEILEEGTAVGKRAEVQAEFIDGSCLKKGSVNDAASGEKNPFNAKQLAKRLFRLRLPGALDPVDKKGNK